MLSTRNNSWDVQKGLILKKPSHWCDCQILHFNTVFFIMSMQYVPVYAYLKYPLGQSWLLSVCSSCVVFIFGYWKMCYQNILLVYLLYAKDYAHMYNQNAFCKKKMLSHIGLQYGTSLTVLHRNLSHLSHKYESKFNLFLWHFISMNGKIITNTYSYLVCVKENNKCFYDILYVWLCYANIYLIQSIALIETLMNGLTMAAVFINDFLYCALIVSYLLTYC